MILIQPSIDPIIISFGFIDIRWYSMAYILAFIFGWLAFRSRVTGVYLSILTQAMTLALALYLFQNDSGLRGNNGLSGLQNIPGLETVSQAVVSISFMWASAFALALGYLLAAWIVSGKFGNIIGGIRDDEPRIRFLGYPVKTYKLFIIVWEIRPCYYQDFLRHLFEEIQKYIVIQ